MASKFDYQEIRQYWNDQAVQHGQSYSASWSDKQVIDLEIREISSRLTDGDRVLDVGCANGYSTIGFASEKRIQIRGIDYIPEMIRQARSSLEKTGPLKDCVEFDEGDATCLRESAGAYDKVVCVRVLINLQDWGRQKQGLQECARVLKPGGELLLSEATLQGWQAINALRGIWGLGEIPMPNFNLYLDQAKVLEAVAPELELVELVDFASSYYLGSRFLKPLAARLFPRWIDVADPRSNWNVLAARLPAFGRYGIQKLFHFRKR